MNTRNTVVALSLLIAWFAVSALKSAEKTRKNGTAYFVNSETGDDKNVGTSEKAPWKTLAPVTAKALQPGDVVNFARGSVWTGQIYPALFTIPQSGTVEKPITFRAYGKGEMPTFSNIGKYNSAVLVSGKYVVIDGLKVDNTGYNGFEMASGAEHNVVQNCEISRTGTGVMVRKNSSHHLFTKNYIHDLHMIVDDTGPHCGDRKDPQWSRKPCDNDYGCVSFWLYGPNNEISYNRCINNRGHSYDYKYDGGFVEFYDNTDGTYAHHNWTDVGMGVAEGSNGHGKDITIAYNVFIESKGLFAIHDNIFKLTNFKFENNTVITKEGTLWNSMFGGTRDMTIRNNIFVLGSRPSEMVGKSNDFIHTNNLYWLLDGATMGAVTPGPGEIIGDPKFVDFANKDYRLKPDSPALRAGAKLGYKADYSNNPIPTASLPEIGAYQFAGAKL